MTLKSRIVPHQHTHLHEHHKKIINILARHRPNDKVIAGLGQPHRREGVHLRDISDPGLREVVQDVRVPEDPCAEKRAGERDGHEEVDGEGLVLEGAELVSC